MGGTGRKQSSFLIISGSLFPVKKKKKKKKKTITDISSLLRWESWNPSIIFSLIREIYEKLLTYMPPAICSLRYPLSRAQISLKVQNCLGITLKGKGDGIKCLFGYGYLGFSFFWSAPSFPWKFEKVKCSPCSCGWLPVLLSEPSLWDVKP